MKNFRKTIFCAICATAFLLSSCQKDETVDFTGISSVQVENTSVTLSSKGSATVRFKVTPADALFDVDPSSDDFAIVIRLASSGFEPTQYSISEAMKLDSQTGEYKITLTDLGISTNYSNEINIGIMYSSSQGARSIALSDGYVTVTSEKYSFRSATFTGLPVLYVNTQNGKGISSETEWVKAYIRIDGGTDYESFSFSPCRIKGRGNTTWHWSKKPYAIALDSRSSLLGMKKQKRWVLLANFMDRTLMRNAIAYDCGQASSLAWTPHYRFVELMLNGIHEGSYMLIEQIRVDKNRVNITPMTPSDNSEPEVSGGYLLEMDFHYDNEIQWKSSHGFPFAIKYPDADSLSPTQISWIRDYISKTESVLYSSNYLDPATGYRSYLDLQSFVDYWLIYELMINHEPKNPGSVFLYKDRGGKLFAGPIWDFDWGTLGYNCSPQAKGKLFLTDAIWYSRMTTDPAFRALAKQRWAAMKPKFVEIESNFDKYREYLSVSAQKNFLMWNPSGDAADNGGNIVNGDENMTFDAAVTRAKSIYTERIQDIDACLASW